MKNRVLVRRKWNCLLAAALALALAKVMATDVSNKSSNEASKGLLFIQGASALTNSFSLARARELARGSHHEAAD